MYPKESWVAKWTQLVMMVPGNYAITLEGYNNPEDEEEEEDDYK